MIPSKEYKIILNIIGMGQNKSGGWRVALKKCKECGKEISTEAKTCPNCGANNCRNNIGCGTVILVIIVGMIWIKACDTTPPPTVQSYKDKALERKAEIENVPLTEKGKKVKAKHPSWTNDICNTVATKKIRIGMTSDQVKAAWGRPYKINTSQGSYGVHEQWVMYESGSDYVYFENGIMTSLQQSK